MSIRGLAHVAAHANAADHADSVNSAVSHAIPRSISTICAASPASSRNSGTREYLQPVRGYGSVSQQRVGYCWRTCQPAKALNREMRVWAGGISSNQFTRRSMFMATAGAIGGKCVLAWPRERARRSAKARTPWESGPAIPARLVYKRWPASLLCWTRAVWSASCWARGPNRSFRRICFARVHP